MFIRLRRLFSWVARRGKTVAGWMIFRSGLYRWMRRDEAVIVVFHRVNDAYPGNPITCTAREFEQFVRFFARHFEVVPLSQLVDRLANGAKLGGAAIITFDDGYEGNATVAAPILERYGVRGCFFVTTEFIGTDYIPWWDRDQRIDTRWMTWDQVRALRAAGHDIGSHTETHANLGVTIGEEARREIGGGNARLEAELGESSGLFAYPYGGLRNMAKENQPFLRELGLRCCVSAYGGTVHRGDDPFRLRRITISNWFISPYHFGFELLAGRLEEG